MKIAVIGSREKIKKEKVFDILSSKFINKVDVEFLSGGARGVDSFVEEWCLSNNKPIKIINPINPKDKLSYLFRNIEIITMSDEIIAFWNGESKGTKFVIDYAKARGKNMEVITK